MVTQGGEHKAEDNTAPACRECTVEEVYSPLSNHSYAMGYVQKYIQAVAWQAWRRE